MSSFKYRMNKEMKILAVIFLVCIFGIIFALSTDRFPFRKELGILYIVGMLAVFALQMFLDFHWQRKLYTWHDELLRRLTEREQRENNIEQLQVKLRSQRQGWRRY